MNYPYPPPWGWGYGGPPQNNRHHGGNQQKVIERAVRNALRLRDQPKKDKRKRREEQSKRFAKTRTSVVHFIEIFILGVLMHPIVGPAYHYITNHVSTP